jgi:hypothetical protein
MRLLSSCGDRHYVGLNGVELVDQFDMKVTIMACVDAMPHMRDVLCCRLPSFTSTMDVCTVLSRTPPSRTQNTNVACSRVLIPWAS